MRSPVVLRSVLAVLSSCLMQGVEASPLTSTVSVEVNKHYERPVLKYLWPALQKANKAGRIYYEGICPPPKGYPLAFPRIEVRAPVANATGLTAVRGIFLKEGGVLVAEDPLGIIRVRVGRVPDAILRTRTLSLNGIEQYNPLPAIWAIQNAPEVQSAAERLHIALPLRVINMHVLRPAEGLSHLPAELSNITMDQALDMVATTWSGIVLYGVCTSPSTYEVSFADGIDVRGSGLVSSTE